MPVKVRKVRDGAVALSGSRGNVLAMAADYAALEARVTELEQQMRHVLPGKIDAVSYGLSLVHEDVRAIRETLGEHGRALDEHGRMLAEILRRLPPGA